MVTRSRLPRLPEGVADADLADQERPGVEGVEQLDAGLVGLRVGPEVQLQVAERLAVSVGAVEVRQ